MQGEGEIKLMTQLEIVGRALSPPRHLTGHALASEGGNENSR